MVDRTIPDGIDSGTLVGTEKLEASKGDTTQYWATIQRIKDFTNLFTEANTYYVDQTKGNDSNTGLRWDEPFQNLEAANTAMLARPSPPSATNPYLVKIAAGSYTQSSGKFTELPYVVYIGEGVEFNGEINAVDRSTLIIKELIGLASGGTDIFTKASGSGVSQLIILENLSLQTSEGMRCNAGTINLNGDYLVFTGTSIISPNSTTGSISVYCDNLLVSSASSGSIINLPNAGTIKADLFCNHISDGNSGGASIIMAGDHVANIIVQRFRSAARKTFELSGNAEVNGNILWREEGVASTITGNAKLKVNIINDTNDNDRTVIANPDGVKLAFGAANVDNFSVSEVAGLNYLESSRSWNVLKTTLPNTVTTWRILGNGAANARAELMRGDDVNAYRRSTALTTSIQESYGSSITQHIFNSGNDNVDFKVRGQTDSDLLQTDAANNRVGVGIAPTSKFHVSGDFNLADTGVSLKSTTSGTKLEFLSGSTVIQELTNGTTNFKSADDFKGYTSSLAVNVTGDGTIYTLLANEIRDKNGNYNPATGTFTVAFNRTGTYYFYTNVLVDPVGGSHTAGEIYIQLIDPVAGFTRTEGIWGNPANENNNNLWGRSVSLSQYLNATSTVRVKIQVSGGTKSVGILAGSTFGGFFWSA